MEIQDIILKARPKISKNSLSNYVRNISILNEKKPIDNLNFLKDTDKILHLIKDKKVTTKRTMLTAVTVLLGAINDNKFNETMEFYQKKLKEMSDEINSNYVKGEKTDKEEKNWLTYDELKEIQREYAKDIDELNLRKANTITPKNNKKLLYYLISSLYTLHPPIRLNWAMMKVIKNKNEMKDKENYLLNSGTFSKTVYLNDFKNVKVIGTQSFKLSKALCKVINLYLKFNTGKYLLNNTRGHEMSANSLSKMLPLVFSKDGKKVNLNMIRKSAVNDLIDPEQIKKEQELAKSMLHSEGVQKSVYLKK